MEKINRQWYNKIVYQFSRNNPGGFFMPSFLKGATRQFGYSLEQVNW